MTAEVSPSCQVPRRRRTRSGSRHPYLRSLVNGMARGRTCSAKDTGAVEPKVEVPRSPVSFLRQVSTANFVTLWSRELRRAVSALFATQTEVTGEASGGRRPTVPFTLPVFRWQLGKMMHFLEPGHTPFVSGSAISTSSRANGSNAITVPIGSCQPRWTQPSAVLTLDRAGAWSKSSCKSTVPAGRATGSRGVPTQNAGPHSEPVGT